MCFNIDLSLSFSFVKMFLTFKQYFSEPFLVSIFALFVSFSSECFADSWSSRSISDCAPFSMFDSVLSTSSLRERGFHSHHLVAAVAQTQMFGVCLMLLFVTPSEFFTASTLFFISATCSFRLESRIRPLLGPCLVFWKQTAHCKNEQKIQVKHQL